MKRLYLDVRSNEKSLNIWANPRLDHEPSVDVATIRLQIPDFHFDSLSITSRYTTDFDEIRLGPGFRSVVPHN